LPVRGARQLPHSVSRFALSTRRPTMTHDATRQELLALEKQYWNAIKANDAATATSLSDDPCVVVGAQGVGELSRSSLAKMMQGARYKLEDYALDDVHLRPISDDVVALAYKVTEDLVVEGERIKL